MVTKIILFIVVWLIGFILTGNRLWKEGLIKLGACTSDDIFNHLAVYVGLRAAVWFIYWPVRGIQFIISKLKPATKPELTIRHP